MKKHRAAARVTPQARPAPVRPAAPGLPAVALPHYLADVPRIHLALAASIIVHALLLTISFSFPNAPREFKDKALEIVLVNSKSKSRPQDAQALAQTHLDGGGNVDDNRRAKTPLPPSPNSKSGDRLEDAQQRVRELERAQRQLMVQARKIAPAAGGDAQREPAPEAPQPAPTGRELATSALAMVRLQAEIDRSVEAYNKRPRRQFVGARTAEYRFAQYVEDWRLKVERVGTLNYPQAARGSVYGSVLITVVLHADGKLEKVEINRSSGHKLLDEGARRIVQMASPYAPFPPDIRADTDILEITRTIFFTRDETVRSQ